MVNLKINNKTQLHLINAGGNNDIVNSGAENTCLYTVNNNTTINTDIVCSNIVNTKLDVHLLSSGYSPNINSIYKGNSKTLSIGDVSSGSYTPTLKKIIVIVDFYYNPKNKIIAKLGVVRNITSNGWYPNIKKIPIGNKNAYNPLLFDSLGIGVQLMCENKKVTYYGDIINTSDDSSKYSYSDSYDGFGKTKYPYMNDLGMIVKFESFFPGIVNIHCQRIAGNKNLSDKINSYSNMTINAKNSLIGQYKKNGYMLSVTASGKIKIKDYEISGGITCSNVEAENINNNIQNGRILKWNICYMKECKSFNFLGNLEKQNIYGINISTPGYLSKSVGINKQEKPPISFQVYCVKNICGFNIPIYINLINNHIGGNTIQNGNNVSTQGNAFYVGISPTITFDKVVHTNIA